MSKLRVVRLWRCVFVATLLCAAAVPAAGQGCDCETAPDSICNQQGFRITLVAFSVDQNAGTSSWDYSVCNEKGLGTGCEPPKDLSHVNLDLPGLGSCLGPSQAITLQQIGGFGNAVLACGVSEKDPSCDIFGSPGSDFVAKCDVAGGDVDPGECVTMRLTIAGETPALGVGAAATVTKAGPECVTDCIRGPSCETCDTHEDACLTRTPGFWGTHPHITSQFLPITVCGKPLTHAAAGSCTSVTEALCVAGGKEVKGRPAYAQLVRQLAAAKLNLAATAANGGACDGAIDVRIAQCEALCGANQATISGSGCIEDLTAFNQSQDSLPTTPPPFDSPGPANPRECQTANGNLLVIGLGGCS